MQMLFKPKPIIKPIRRFLTLLPEALLPIARRIGRFFFVNRMYRRATAHSPIKLIYM